MADLYHLRGGVQGYVHPSCFSCIRQVVRDITAVNLHIMVSMAAFTVRNLSDVTLRALRRRAAKVAGARKRKSGQSSTLPRGQMIGSRLAPLSLSYFNLLEAWILTSNGIAHRRSRSASNETRSQKHHFGTDTFRQATDRKASESPNCRIRPFSPVTYRNRRATPRLSIPHGGRTFPGLRSGRRSA